LCTLRRGRHLPRRNTRYQAGATPYLGRTFTGWIAPASPGAPLLLHRSGLAPPTPCRSPGAPVGKRVCRGRRADFATTYAAMFARFTSWVLAVGGVEAVEEKQLTTSAAGREHRV